MSYQVILTAQAKDDLRSIYNYIAHNLLAPDTGAKLYVRIKKAILSLSCLPERYPLYQDEPWRCYGLREMQVHNYAVFYSVNKESVVVIRVMYGRRDISTQLKDIQLDEVLISPDNT